MKVKAAVVAAAFVVVINYKIKTATITIVAVVVENIGVEPMTSCMPCKRSSQLS
jgi:hypothetical protein